MKKAFLAIAMIILIIGGIFYFFPIQTFQAIEIVRMELSGVSNTKTPEFHYFEKNNCADLKNCQCVLLLHGLGDFALTWTKLMSEGSDSFSKKLHFFAPNLPGALSTPKLSTQEDYNVQKMAKLVSDYFLPKCDDWVIAGNSYGGWMSVFMALNSDKIKGLLLLGAAGIKKDYSPILDYFLNPTIAGARGFYERLYYHPKKVPDYIFQRIVERVKTQTVVDQLKSINEEDFLDHHLKNLKIPIQYVWGEADRVIPAQWAVSYKEMTPNSTLTIIKECGHVPQKECTSEVISELNNLLIRMNPI